MELNVGSSVFNFQVKKSHPLARFSAILLRNLTGNALVADKKRSEQLFPPKLDCINLGFICDMRYIILQLKKKKEKKILDFTSKEV